MNAIVIGLPGGLETAVASSGKKDDNPALFADTFQQASSSAKDQVTKAVTKKTDLERNALPSSKAGAASSTVNPQKETTGTSGRASVAIRTKYKSLTGALAEGGGDGPLAVSAKKNSSVVALDDQQVVTDEPGEPAGTPGIDLREKAEPGIDRGKFSAEVKRQSDFKPVEFATVAGGEKAAQDKPALKFANVALVDQKDANVSGSFSPGANDLLSSDISREVVSHRTVSKRNDTVIGTTVGSLTPDLNQTALQASQEQVADAIIPDHLLGAGVVEAKSEPVTRLTPSIVDLPATVIPSAVPVPDGSSTGSASPNLATPLADAGKHKVAGFSGPATSGKTALSRSGSPVSKSATGAANAKANQPTPSVESTVATVQNTSVPVAISVFQTVATPQAATVSKLDANDGISPELRVQENRIEKVAPQIAPGLADFIGTQIEDSVDATLRASSKGQPGKSVDRHGDLEREKAAGSATGETAKVSIGEDDLASSLAAPRLLDSQIVPGVSAPVAGIVSPGLSEAAFSQAVSTVSAPTYAAGSSIASPRLLAANQGVQRANVAVSASSLAASGGSADKKALLSSGQGALPKLQKLEVSRDGEGVATAEGAGEQVAASGPSSGVANGGNPNQEAVTTSATSLAQAKQAEAVGSHIPSSARERKSSVAETKTGDVKAPSGPAVTVHDSLVEGSTSAVVQITGATGVHRATVAEGGSTASAPSSTVDSTVPAAQSHAAVIIGSVDQAVIHKGTESVSDKTPGLIASGVIEGAHTGLPAANDALSPLAHTTLAATPTVLEVGVPGGTQGWLKIRAEIGEGGLVQASMSSSTHAGQDALHRDLPAINAFLESEHLQVSVQVAHSTSTGNLPDGIGLLKDGGFNPGSSLGQSLNQDANSSPRQSETASGTLAGNGGGQNSQRHQELSQPTGQASVSPAVSDAVHGGLAARDSGWTAPKGYGSGSAVNGGSWLNVMA